MRITETPKTNNKNLVLSSAAGAIAGCGARYIIPTKQEFTSLFNKKAFDTFTSSASTGARGADRSILKYAGIGAAIAAGLSYIVKSFTNKNQEENVEYTKLGALLDSSDYACQVLWYQG